MATLTNTIPEKTIERLSEYRRTLLEKVAYFVKESDGSNS